MEPKGNFFNLYNHRFVRASVAVPNVRVADPAFNAEQTLAAMQQATDGDAIVVVFPELGLSAYSCEDLFHQRALIEGCQDALTDLLHRSRELPVLAAVGLPVEVDGLLYNCAAVIHRGRVLGVVPKTYLPNYQEYYELRHFAPAACATRERIAIADQTEVPFGDGLLFEAEDLPDLRLHVELCEDLWAPIPPSSYGTLAGATVVANLSASNVTVGKDAYRHQLVANQSARCLAGYLYSAAGSGESTTDLAWDGHAMIYENGALLGEARRFAFAPQLVTADIDLERLVQDRMRHNTFAQSLRQHRANVERFRRVRFRAEPPREQALLLEREYERYPYVPSDPADRDARCEEVYSIQVQGLAKRLQSTGIGRVAIGISGGLDSTQALLVCARAMDLMGLDRGRVLAYIMPGFGTSERTLDQARRLTRAIGCTTHEIDIRPACRQVLADIGHPYAHGEAVYDVTFENVQAGERTSLLFRLANQHDALVVGTSDLSELALGWCTYGVGDQMAHYHVNASVPKTLVQYLIRWVAETGQLDGEVSEVLRAVLETDISPELVPDDASSKDQPAQRTEETIGPYALQDFHLYYTLRFGYTPPKVAFLAYCAWHDRARGRWPGLPQGQHREYTIGEIKHWLGVFLHRFFKLSQFKRSAIPNAPKIGSGGSLSPRGDWRAPSDSEADVWLAQLERVPGHRDE